MAVVIAALDRRWCWIALLLLTAVRLSGPVRSQVGGGIIETGLEFVIEPEDVVVITGVSFVWNCSAVSSTGLPVPTITWLKDGQLIGDGRRSVLPSGALSIRKIVQRPSTQGDEDIYECLATNSVGSITSRPVLLRIAYIDVSSDRIQQETVISGRLLRLACSVYGLPTPHIVWSRDGFDFPTTDSLRMTHLNSGVLQIYPVHTSDSGVYRCRGSNTAGTRLGSEIPVVVTQESAGGTAIHLVARPSNLTVLAGETVQLECAVSMPSSRDLHIIWTRQDGVLLPEGRWRVIGSGNLQLSSVVAGDTAVYICTLDEASLTAAASLAVYVAPQLVHVSENMIAAIGSPVRMDCQFYGVPTPAISWAKDSYALWSTARVHVQNGTVLISEAVADDAGLYQCWAESDAGIEYAVIRLAVKTFVTALPIVPDAGDAPSPPTDLVARLVGSRTIELHWKEPPLQNGSPIVAYSVHYHSVRSGELQKVIRDTSITLSQLAPFTNYTFFVKAYNTRSSSGPSSSVSLFTGDDVPVGVPAVQLSIANTSLLVEWSVLPPEKARGRITGYHVLLRQRSTGNQPSMEQPVVVTVANFTQHVIDDVAVGVTYDVLVLACNSAGCTSWEDKDWPLAHITIPYRLAPVALHAEALNESAILVTWAAKGTPPYTLHYWLADADADAISVVSETESVTVTGLKPFTQYKFSIFSSNTALYNITSCRTAESLPGPPTDLRAEVTQSQQNSAQTVNVRLTWKPPTHVNGVIRSYEISLSTNSSLPDRLWTNIVSNGSQQWFVLKNLNAAYSVYYVKLRVANGRGAGAASATIAISTVVTDGSYLREWEIGIIVGACVGICCIIVCVIVIVAMSRRRERSAQHASSATAQSSSYHPCDTIVGGTSNTRVAVIGSRGNHKQHDREMDSFQPMLAGSEDHCTVGIATTDFGRDCNHSNQLPTGDKSKQFITSAVADDSMTPLCADCLSSSHNDIDGNPVISDFNPSPADEQPWPADFPDDVRDPWLHSDDQHSSGLHLKDDGSMEKRRDCSSTDIN